MLGWIQRINRSSIKTPLDLKLIWINEPLQTSIPLELVFTAPARWAQEPLSQPISGFLHNLLEGLHEITFSTTSREWQLPRVTNQWRLLEDSLVPQSSNPWCNALGCSHTHKNAIPNQRVRERGRPVQICQGSFQSGQESPLMVGHGIYIGIPSKSSRTI